ncbi:transmembrane protein, putative, partial [Bodo saltans]
NGVNSIHIFKIGCNQEECRRWRKYESVDCIVKPSCSNFPYITSSTATPSACCRDIDVLHLPRRCIAFHYSFAVCAFSLWCLCACSCRLSSVQKVNCIKNAHAPGDPVRATGQEVRAYVPFVNRNENVAWRAPVARQQPPPPPPPPPPAAAAVPPAQPAALMPGIPRWVQRMVGTVLRDTNRLDREERNGGGAAVSVETPHQLLQGCIIAAATSYGVYLVATYVLRVAFHAAMLVPTNVYVGVGVTAAALVAVSKSH